jgi:predicted ester cyclase
MRRFLFGLGLSMFLAVPAAAHHNWAAFFDVEGDVEFEGVIESIQFRNPHVRVTFLVDGGTPDEKTYWTESNSVAALTRMGVTKELLTVGTRVRVAGYPSRADTYGVFMNHMLLPDGQEIVFLRTAEPRWPDAQRIGNTDIAHGRVHEEDFSKRPTSIFSVWNTIFGAEGSHRALRYPVGSISINYAEPRGVGSCVSKDLWEQMGSPYPMQIVDNDDGSITVHVEEYDTIRTVHMNIEHKDPGTVKNNLGYSNGYMEDGKLFVTTTFAGSNSPVVFKETFQLSEDHNRLEYTNTLSNPETGASAENAKWWEYQPNSFVQAYDCISGDASIANASTDEVQANKATVTRILEVKGTPDYRTVAKEVFSKDHKVLRNEFENLIYNADDPKIYAVAEPDYQAITERTNTIERIFGEGDRVAAMVRVRGKHTGNLYGIPATGKSFNIITTAIFKLANGKIVESWYLAEEAGLLVQLGARIPARVDGKVNLPPVHDDVRTYDEALAEHLASPKDTPEWRHTRLLLSYKSQPENRPADYTWKGRARPYSNLQRGGIDVLVKRAAELNVEGSHGQSMSDRRDMVGHVISEGNMAVMTFRLTARNSGPLFSAPASGHALHDWEIGFAEFDGDTWVNAWWMADELGFLLSIGNQEALEFLGGGAPQER